MRATMLAVVVLAACAPKPEPFSPVCDDFDCGLGRCVVVNETAACICDDGAAMNDGRCTPVDTLDRCASKPCEGLPNSVCLTENGATRCVCPATRIEIAGECVVRTACTPNPCTAPNQTTCDATSGTAVCLCDADTVPTGSGCGPFPWGDCSAVHAGDRAEPDECPRLAFELQRDEYVDRSLSPDADQDWFRLKVTPGYVVAFTAAGHVPLQLDVFTTAAVRIAGDGRGVPEARVVFAVPPGNDVVFVRVRARLATDRDTYIAQFKDLGHDDFVNAPDDALLLTPGEVSFGGTVQYEGDVDVVKLQLPRFTAVEFSSDGGGIAEFELTFSDGGTRRIDGFMRSFTPPTDETVVITTRARDDRGEGVFHLDIRRRGIDDHSDDSRFAREVQPNVLISGAIQFVGDVDSFLFRPAPQHIYRTVVTKPNATVNVVNEAGVVLGTSTWRAPTADLAVMRISAATAGSYDLQVQDLGVDSHGDDFAQATALTLPATITSTLELDTDADVFTFNATAGHAYRVTTQVGDGLASVMLFDVAGIELVSGTDGVSLFSAGGGRYFVMISGESGVYPKNYRLDVHDLGLDENAGPAAPQPLVLATTQPGALQYEGDVDSFAVNTTAQRVYRVSCLSAPIGECALGVTGPGQVLSGENELRFLSNGGVHRIDVGAAPGATVPLQWALSVVDEGPDDHGASVATATAVQVNSAAVGTLGWANDIDMFTAPVREGSLYEVRVTGAQYPQVQVTRSNGAPVVPLGDAFAFRAAAAETVRVALRPFDSSRVGAYTLTVLDVGSDDHGDTLATATALGWPGTRSAKVQFAGDIDSFVLPVVAGNLYGVAAGTCERSVRTADGTLVALTGGAFKAPVGVTQVELRVTSTNSITCTVETFDYGIDDHGDTAASATVLSGDGGVSGALQSPGDVDVFAFDVAAISSQVVQVEFESTPLLFVSVISPSGARQETREHTGFPAGEVGRWVVEAQQPAAASASYFVNVSTTTDDVPGVMPLALDTFFTGRLEHPADVDVFTVTLPSAGLYELEVAGVATATIENASGLVSGVGDFYAETAGAYEVRVTRRPFLSGWSPAPYMVAVTTL
ncbi:MAG: hypothetical protein ACO1OB_13085 [Archangium sp.]